jgi:hypothetical protein
MAARILTNAQTQASGYERPSANAAAAIISLPVVSFDVSLGV